MGLIIHELTTMATKDSDVWVVISHNERHLIEDREDVDKDSDMWIAISHNEHRAYVNQQSAIKNLT